MIDFTPKPTLTPNTMKVTVPAGGRLVVEFDQTDGEIVVSFSETDITVSVDLPDDTGREGEIYRTSFYESESLQKTEVTESDLAKLSEILPPSEESEDTGVVLEPWGPYPVSRYPKVLL